MKFAVHSTVRVTRQFNPTEPEIGSIGTIVESGLGGIYRVRLAAGGECWLADDSFESISIAEAQQLSAVAPLCPGQVGGQSFARSAQGFKTAAESGAFLGTGLSNQPFTGTAASVLTPTYHDSGARTSFETGAVRDVNEGKGLPHMIPPIALRKIAVRFEEGAKKYARNNWMKGIPLSRYHDAILRHTTSWAEGDTSEDHIGAAIWNTCCAAWTEEQIKLGRLPASLDDLPYRPRK